MTPAEIAAALAAKGWSLAASVVQPEANRRASDGMLRGHVYLNQGRPALLVVEDEATGPRYFREVTHLPMERILLGRGPT